MRYTVTMNIKSAISVRCTVSFIFKQNDKDGTQ